MEKSTQKIGVRTIATTFKTLAVTGAKDRETLAKNIVADLRKNGVTVNIKGRAIKEENVQRQINSMLRDIKKERGKDTKSWWAQYKIIENANELKIVAK